MATRLKELKVVEVSLVDRPANKRPLLLLRSADEMAANPTITVPEDMVSAFQSAAVAADGEDAAVAGLAKESQGAARIARRALAAVKAAGGDPLAIIKDDVDALVAKAIDNLEKAAADAPGQGDDMDKCPNCGATLGEGEAEKGTCKACGKALKVASVEPADKAELATLAKEAGEAKSALAEIQKAHADLVKAHEEAVAKLAAEVAERKTRDAVAKAAGEFPTMKAADVAFLIVKAESMGKEYVEKLEAVLKQADALAQQGLALKEIGTHGEAGGDAWDKIEAGALAMVAKSGEKLTKAQAIGRFLDTPEGRALHRDYQAAQ